MLQNQFPYTHLYIKALFIFFLVICSDFISTKSYLIMINKALHRWSPTNAVLMIIVFNDSPKFYSVALNWIVICSHCRLQRWLLLLSSCSCESHWHGWSEYQLLIFKTNLSNKCLYCRHWDLITKRSSSIQSLWFSGNSCPYQNILSSRFLPGFI